MTRASLKAAMSLHTSNLSKFEVAGEPTSLLAATVMLAVPLDFNISVPDGWLQLVAFRVTALEAQRSIFEASASVAAAGGSACRVCFSSASSEAPLIGAVIVGGEEWTRRTHPPLACCRHRLIIFQTYTYSPSHGEGRQNHRAVCLDFY